MSTDHTVYLTGLHRLIDQYFDLEEMRSLCFGLGLEYDSLRGEGKAARVRELIVALGRNGRLPDLLNLAQRERPTVAWPPVPPDFEPPTSAELAGGTPGSQHIYQGDVVHGDQVGGDNVSKDKITVGDFGTGQQGIAIGRKAQVQMGNAQPQSGPANVDLTHLFTSLLLDVARHQPAAVAKVQALQVEVERGETATDERIADLIGDIAEAAPAVIESLLNLFADPVVTQASGAGTKQALKWLRRQAR